MTITIHTSDVRPGGGKTNYVIKTMVQFPGKYVYAVDRVDVFDTRASLIESHANGKNIKIVQLNTTTSFQVRADLRQTASEYQDDEHVVVITTHAALLTSDLSSFFGWELVIDENPQCWQMQTVKTATTRSALKCIFKLKKEPNKEHYRIMLRDGVDADALMEDTFVSPALVNLYRAVRSGKVLCDTKDFEKKQWEWWSVFNFDNLNSFKAIYIVANAFSQSLTSKLMHSSGIAFKPLRLDTSPYQPRKLTIKYFSNSSGSHGYFRSENGQQSLKAIGEYFHENKISVDIWSCNNDADKGKFRPASLLRLPGRYIRPAVAGSNEYINCTSAAFIYSAKPSDREVARLSAFGAITKDDIIRSRETETVIQFITRLALRDANDAKDCTVYLYDKSQALAAQKFFQDLNLPLTIELEKIDLMVGAPSAKQRLTLEEKKANKAALNRAAYLARKAGK